MRVLITGITGFVGIHLNKALLKQNNEIIGVGREPNASKNIISYDQLFDGREGVQSSVWVHLAGMAQDKKNADASRYFEVNTELTKRIFNHFLKDNSAHTFIFFSSVKAASARVNDVLTELERGILDTAYGESKRAAEDFLLSQELPSGKRLIILRPTMIHGEGNQGNLKLLYKFVQKGIPYPFGAFECQRSFLAIDNLIFLLEKIIDNKDLPSGVYNVADDNPVSMDNLIGFLATTANKPKRIWKVPAGFIRISAKFGDLLKLPVNTQFLQKLTDNYVVSNQKIKDALNIDKLPVTAEEGIKKTASTL